MEKALSTFLFVILAFVAHAQPGPPPPDPGQPLPITGIEILLVGGAALGASRVLKRRNSENRKGEN